MHHALSLLLRVVTALALPALLAPGSATAAEADQRMLKLSDGRELLGTVAESTAEGMIVLLPQGRLLVRYDQLLEIDVVAGAATPPPMRIAVAPTSWTAGAAADVAALDGLLSEVVRLIPSVEVVAPGEWAAKGAPGALACAGELACLAALARKVGASYVLVPRVGAGDGAPTVAIQGGVVTSGAVIASGTSAARGAPHELAPTLLAGSYAALGLTPTEDPGAVAARAFPTPAIVAASPEPTEPVAGEGPAAAEAPETAEATGTATAGADPEPAVAAAPAPKPRTAPAPTAGVAAARQLPVAVALGFVPVPGITSAYLGDVPGFIVSLVGTVALGWTAVYTLGATIRWERPFVASSILVPYALSVTFNQVTGLVGWNRLHGKRASGSAVLPLGAAVAPVLTRDERGDLKATGAALSWSARF